MGPFHLRSIYVRLERQEEFPRIRHHLLHALPAAILHAALLVHLERQKKGGVKFGLDGMLKESKWVKWVKTVCLDMSSQIGVVCLFSPFGPTIIEVDSGWCIVFAIFDMGFINKHFRFNHQRCGFTVAWCCLKMGAPQIAKFTAQFSSPLKLK